METASGIHRWPPGERPRERLAERGSEALSDAELLAVLLGAGVSGASAVELARGVLQQRGGWRALDRMSVRELMKVRGIGLAKATQVKAALELARRVAREAAPERARVSGADDVLSLVGLAMRDLPREQVRALYLNAKHRVVAERIVAEGSLTQSLIHPREIFHAAVHESAAAVIVVHNHPSGDPTPSEEDVTLTQRLVEAGRILGIPLLDHVIIGADRWVSLRAMGVLAGPEARRDA